ncbi:MAG: ATPase, T2SS/T4P/T4SS family, partial [bacterium]
MSVPKSHSSCRAFAILDAARGDARPGAADGVAGWLSARGVAVLVVESDAKGAGRGRAARSIEDLPRQMDGLEGEVLRGFLANGSAKMGMLALGNRAPEKEVLRALASAYEFILFEMGAADVAGDPGALERLCAFREVPALIVASLSAEGSIALANRAIEAMLALEKSPRPVAFAVTPFDGTAAARLARRWRIASWGDASDFGRISQRMLDRAAALTALDGSAKSSPVSRDSAQRVAREVLGRIREEGDLGDEGLRDRIAAEARRITGSLAPENFGGALQAEVVAHVVDDALGCGPLAPLFSDPDVTEVMVCNARNVYIEREGRIERTDQRFADDAHLMAVIERLLLPTGRRLDEASPAVDARLPDGSRLHAIIPPLSIDGPALTIRRFHRSITGVAQAVEMGMMPARIAAFLCACVRARISIV